MATPPFRVKALYDYQSEEPDDLKFPNGQLITVTEEEDADWYFGEYDDSAGSKQEGLFPKNFVKIFEPETPPRPSRMSRSKKELESSAFSNEAEKSPSAQEADVQSPEASAPLEDASVPSEPIDVKQEPNVQQLSVEAAPATPPTMKPALPVASKPTPPRVDKPASGSFRDRINAFNKPAAPPVAPMKPSVLGASGSGFIKKPFVAPPPSKNAYVPPPREPPPQKVYRREEDPEIMAQAPREAENDDIPTQPQTAPSTDDAEDQPKPTSLKDRIALLQKQQMEQAARHVEAGQKKEKAKRPPRRPVEPQDRTLEREEEFRGDNLERMNSSDTTGKRSMDAARPSARPRKSREATPVGSPGVVAPRELLSDPNDADQSGVGDTEDGEELSTGRDDSDEKPHRKGSLPSQRTPQARVQEADIGDEEDNAEGDEAEEEEEEDVDPEMKRRMDIRERMAKMSGGMGMAGMFGPPGGMPPRIATKQVSGSSDRKASGNSTSALTDSPQSRAPPVPIMPMSGLQEVRSPEQDDFQPEGGSEDADELKSVRIGKDLGDAPEVEDMEEPVAPSRRSTERAVPSSIPQDRPVPLPPGQSRGAPPPVPSERPTPPPPSESRSVPRLPPSQPMSPSEGSESDDEMSLHARSSLKIPAVTDSARPSSRGAPPPVPPSAGPPPSLPNRSAAPQSYPSDYVGQSLSMDSSEMSSTSPQATPNQSSRVPPVPGSMMPSTPSNRAPPPPPPARSPSSRAPNGDGRMPPVPHTLSKARETVESDEEITEYEGDYDTDMASSAPHKDALHQSHARVSSLEDDSMTDETSLHHSGLPSLGPPMSGAPRAVPPPPPNLPPRNDRQSSEMPRGAPPPPPPPPPPLKEQEFNEEDEDYDPYNYSRSGQRHPSGGRYEMEGPTTPRLEDLEPSYPTSPPQRAMPPPTAPLSQQYASLSNMPVPGRSGPRQSMDVQRTSTTIRRSTDAPRASGEQGFIASDVDLAQGSQWWARPDTPPPAFQNRRDLIFEMEETSTTRRGGKQAIAKIVYVLFMDYSQTVITAHFEAKDPANASLEQRHEPPPQNLRQDQLESAHTRFGSRIAEAANAKEGAVVGDGSPHALIQDLMYALPDALLPVGVRAYGALVYANLANASVRQFDEIRAGDIVTFRNTKFQGHRGAMHTKYAIEVGKPDHVGVVIDWDGTKKKVRAWEQGRESKKVKAESFKFGDMKSGEVKVWRVMARSWVGWEGQN